MKKLLFLAIILAGTVGAGNCIVGTRQVQGFHDRDGFYYLWYDFPNGEHRLAKFYPTAPRPFYASYDFTRGRFCP
jgi:hypothetical protein